ELREAAMVLPPALGSPRSERGDSAPRTSRRLFRKIQPFQDIFASQIKSAPIGVCSPPRSAPRSAKALRGGETAERGGFPPTHNEIQANSTFAASSIPQHLGPRSPLCLRATVPSSDS